tara:strand:- start:900 stop:1298 length:399 start_codon:yes stop_codon:yes gene_type:complete
MRDNIIGIYESMYTSSSVLLTEVDVNVSSPEDTQEGISDINIFIKPDRGPIQRPYSGQVVNSTRLEGNFTLIAKDTDNNKLIQVILLDDGDISVNIQDEAGSIQDTFIGKDLDFYDQDEGKKELNIMKIESV